MECRQPIALSRPVLARALLTLLASTVYRKLRTALTSSRGGFFLNSLQFVTMN
jgi:hypothetical protein